MKTIINFIKSRKISIIIAVALIIFLVVRVQKNATASQELITQNPTVQDITQTLELTGYVDAKEKANLHFLAPSRLSWVGVKEGEEVKKWQAIATVDTRTLQKQLSQDLNNFSKEFNDHDQTLSDQDYYGTPDLNRDVRRILENAQYDLNNSVINVEIRDLAVRLSSLISPIEGIITRVDESNPGVNISITDIFQVVNPETVYFSAQVDELDVSKVVVGQKGLITLDAFEDEEIETTVEFVSFTPVTSATGGTSYRVEFFLTDQNDILKYKLGMSGDVELLLEKKDAVITIPSESVIERDEKTYVEIQVESGEVEKREVETGLETDDFIEVVSGLSESDIVIIPQ